jgi:dihydroneopterin aldolase
MSFYGYHGNSPAEKETGRRFEVDCELVCNTGKAVAADSLAETVDYTKVYDMIEDMVKNNRFNLIETLANRLADDVLNSFDVRSIKIRVRKMTPPIPGNIDSFEVEVERSK